MTPLEKIEQKIQRAVTRLASLKEERDNVLRDTTITCGGCNSEHRIGDLTYIQTHWYVRPHGCTGGDYWNEGEGQIECPSCKGTLRLHNNPEISALKRLFKNCVDRHDD